jgi:hypothetical protein
MLTSFLLNEWRNYSVIGFRIHYSLMEMPFSRQKAGDIDGVKLYK